MLKADHPAMVVDADDEHATPAVEEPGKSLRDHHLECRVVPFLLRVPAHRGLELDLVILAVREKIPEAHPDRPGAGLLDHFVDGSGQRRPPVLEELAKRLDFPELRIE